MSTYETIMTVILIILMPTWMLWGYLLYRLIRWIDRKNYQFEEES